jgi:hypothetical protein
MSNTTPIKTQTLMHVPRKGKQFLLHYRHSRVVKNPMLSHVRGKNEVVITAKGTNS